MYVAAGGVGVGPNPLGTNPVLPTDPIFWAFNPIAPKTDIFSGVEFPPILVTGRAGLMSIPTDAQIDRLTPAASRQLQPTDAQPAPADTPLRAGGPIKHVFFVVRENRSYDQMLGDVARGNGDPKLTVFGKNMTPNMHALVTRFPLLDNVYANSEASIQGHYWTASAGVPDYATRNWVQQYGGRATASCSTRPNASTSRTSTTARDSWAATARYQTATAQPPSSQSSRPWRPTPMWAPQPAGATPAT
jgi:hypothetical protein